MLFLEGGRRQTVKKEGKKERKGRKEGRREESKGTKFIKKNCQKEEFGGLLEILYLFEINSFSLTVEDEVETR